MEKDLQQRYSRNIGTITEEEQTRLGAASVCIIGCGGLGGYIAENLARIGVGRLTLVDGDVFSVTNLNRQRFSREDNLGKAKVDEAKKAIAQINSEVVVTTFNGNLTEENAQEIIGDADLVMDALDSIEARLILEDACAECGKYLVHGAINSWFGQLALVPPGSGMLHALYTPYSAGKTEAAEASEMAEAADKAEEPTSSNPPFTPAIIAGMQAAEAVKFLIGRPSELNGKMLFVDLLDHGFDVLEIGTPA